MIFDTTPLETARTYDENGYLHVSTSNITKEQVVPYVGDTIPGWQELGLKPKAVYQIYRPAEEIEKAAATFNGLPLSLDHWEMDAANMPKDKIVGSLGTEATFEKPYLKNSLTVTDADAIARIKSGEFRDLSAGYLCDVEMSDGIFDGKHYDGIMRNIRGNHVALVREGRAGHDVRVADSALKGGDMMEQKDAWKPLFFDLIKALNGGDKPMEEIKKEEVVKEDSAPDMTNTALAVENAPEAPTKDEEPVDVLADELREAMTAAGLDPEDKAAQKAFMAGIAYGKPTEDEKPTEDKCKDTAKDSTPVFDKAMAAALYTAAEEVAPHVGKISNPFAFDSAADIYKKALDAKGVNVVGVVRGQSAAVDFNSMQEFSAEKSSRLPDEPIEKGSFATYNRVIEPRSISCRLSVEGYPSKLQSAIDRLTTLCENDEKITLTTPEQSYPNMMLESFDYRRDAQNGRGVLYVDLRFKEIREVASQQTTTSVEEPIEPEDAEDGSCCDDIDDGELQATDASQAEQDAESGVSGGVIYDKFGVLIPGSQSSGGGGGGF